LQNYSLGKIFKVMKMILALFALLLAIVGGIAFVQTNPKNISFPFFTKTATATIANHTFTLLLAKSAQEKEIGLSEKTSLPQDTGMLFSFGQSDYYSFWMKNMKIPIDMIYINKNKIVTIYENLQPPKSKDESLPILKPSEPSDTVLEINAGLAQKYGFKKGDAVKLENL